jgi:mRNA interferase RelE/StbE
LRVEFKASFAKDLNKVKDGRLLARVRRVIEEVEKAKGLHEIENVKRLRGDLGYYRIRIGDYRLGLLVEGDIATFVRFLHRKDIYRYFP